jgi:hypothetical protein
MTSSSPAASSPMSQVGIVIRDGPSLECSIEDCEEVFVPPSATDCQDAICKRCASGLSVGTDELGSYCGLGCAPKGCSTPNTAARGSNTCTHKEQYCTQCSDGWESELNRTSLLPTGGCTFSCTKEQHSAGCAPHSCSDDGTCSACVPGFTKASQPVSTSFRRLHGPSCIKEKKPVSMNFYMYRAQGPVTHPPENCDLASAAGVMWYLHNEVVQYCPRHYGITRVLRYNVTVFNPESVFPVRHGQFGHFVQFDFGKCTVPKCADQWKSHGFMVGCQGQSSHWKYERSYWYSLPGSCPSMTYKTKTDECRQQEPGGQCASPDGSSNCTWHAELAGEVLVDELSGIDDFKAFCDAHNVEYDPKTDRGRGTDFWDQKLNADRNKERVLTLQRLFAKKYPSSDALSMPEPLCDGW